MLVDSVLRSLRPPPTRHAQAAVRIQRYTRTVLKVILAKRELARRKQEARWKALACDVAQEQCHLVVQFRQETWAVGEMVKALRGHLWWMSVLKAEREDWYAPSKFLVRIPVRSLAMLPHFLVGMP